MLTTKKRFLILPAVAILALVHAGLVSLSSANQGEGYQPAGSWVWSIYSSPVMPPVPALVTLHSDGTGSVATASMFLTPNGGKLSPGHGVWERTGPLSFGGTSLYMRYDSEGELVGFTRARTALYFVNDPDHIAGVMYVETGAPCDEAGCQDPLSPDVVWTGRLLDITGTRIHKVDVPD